MTSSQPQPTETLQRLPLCRACGKAVTVRRSKCSRCRAVYYCNTGCQRRHWPQHRPLCKAPPPELRAKERDQLANKLMKVIGRRVTICHERARQRGTTGFVAVTVNIDDPDKFNTAKMEVVGWAEENRICVGMPSLHTFFADKDFLDRFPFVAPVLVFQVRRNCTFAELLHERVPIQFVSSAFVLDATASRAQIDAWRTGVELKRQTELESGERAQSREAHDKASDAS